MTLIRHIQFAPLDFNAPASLGHRLGALHTIRNGHTKLLGWRTITTVSNPKGPAIRLASLLPLAHQAPHEPEQEQEIIKNIDLVFSYNALLESDPCFRNQRALRKRVKEKVLTVIQIVDADCTRNLFVELVADTRIHHKVAQSPGRYAD